MDIPDERTVDLIPKHGTRLAPELYRSLLRSFPVGAVAVIDRDYRYQLIEGPLPGQLGVPRQQLLGKTIWEVLPEEVAEQRATFYGRALAGETVVTQTTYEDRLYHSQAIPLRDDQKQVIAALLFVEDVTEQRQTQQSLLERAEQQAVVAQLGQQALAGMPLEQFMGEAVASVADVLRVEYAKILELLPEGEHVLLRAGVGWKPEYPIGEATISAGLESQAGYTLISEEPVVVEDLRTETRFDGPPFLHDHNVVSGMSVIIGNAEDPWGIFGAHATRIRHFEEHDIAFLQAVANIVATVIDRQRADQALRESERRFRSTFENAAVGIAHIGLDGSWLRMNNRLCEIVGYTREELLQRSFQDMTHRDDLEADLKEFGRLLDGEINSYQIEKRYLHKNGSIVWILLTVTAQKGEDGTPEYAISIVEDITRRKKVEREREALLQALAEEQEQLRQLMDTLEDRVEQRTEQVRKLASQLTLVERRERRRIAQMLHDDLQQMLVAHQMQLNLLGRRVEGDVREQLGTLEAYTGEMIEVTRSLSVELGAPALRSERLSEATAWLQGYMAERYNLQVDVELKGEAKVPDQDRRELLVGLVRELLFNVVKHAGADRARLAISSDGDLLKIVVEDKGRGFDASALQDNPARNGYGLNSVRERLELFGGALELVSSPGEGTRAVIKVPIR